MSGAAARFFRWNVCQPMRARFSTISNWAPRRCHRPNLARRCRSRIRVGWSGWKITGPAATAPHGEGAPLLTGVREESPPRTAESAPWRPRLLPWAPALTLVALLGPMAAGLLGTLAPALGYMPALGGDALTLAPFADLFAWPGMARASALSVGVGLAATALSLALVVLIAAGWSGTRAFRAVERALSPLLSVPHAA